MTSSDKFKTKTFFVIVDSLRASLEMRLDGFGGLNTKFNFLRKMDTLSPDLIACQGEKLVNDYPEDTLPIELIQFSSLLKTDIGSLRKGLK